MPHKPAGGRRGQRLEVGRRPGQEREGPGGLGRELEASRRPHVEPAAVGDDRAHGGRTERKVGRPQPRGRVGRIDEERVAEERGVGACRSTRARAIPAHVVRGDEHARVRPRPCPDPDERARRVLPRAACKVHEHRQGRRPPPPRSLGQPLMDRASRERTGEGGQRGTAPPLARHPRARQVGEPLPERGDGV